MGVMNEWTASKAPLPERTNHTEEEIGRALTTLVAFGGSPSNASRALKETFDLEISPSKLKSWRDFTYADRYVALQTDHAAAIEEAIVRDTRDLARAAAQVERLAIEKAIDAIEDGNVRPEVASQIALNMAKLKQSNIDKLLALTGRPQAITEHRSAAEIIRALAAKGVVEDA